MYGGGPYAVVKNIPEWKNCSSWKKLHRRGKCYQWTKCRSMDNIVESVSQMDELSHSEQS